MSEYSENHAADLEDLWPQVKEGYRKEDREILEQFPPQKRLLGSSRKHHAKIDPRQILVRLH